MTDYYAAVNQLAAMKNVSHIPWEPTVELMKRMWNEIDKKNNEIKFLCEQGEAQQDEINRRLIQIASMRNALEFYADEDHYSEYNGFLAEQDAGAIAREELRKWP